MIKKILGIFIALSILFCAVFSPQYITLIIALPFIYIIFKIISHKNAISSDLLFISFITFFWVVTFNYIIINHTNIVLRHDAEEFVITSENACLQKTKKISIIILCNEKKISNFDNITYMPIQKDKSYKVISVDSNSENFNHSVIVKLKDFNGRENFVQIKNDEIGNFKINGKTQLITNNFFIQPSYTAAIPIFLAFIVIFGYLFFS